MIPKSSKRSRKVDARLPGKGNSNSHGARPVRLIITVIKWIRTSRLSIKNSLSLATSASSASSMASASDTPCTPKSETVRLLRTGAPSEREWIGSHRLSDHSMQGSKVVEKRRSQHLALVRGRFLPRDNRVLWQNRYLPHVVLWPTIHKSTFHPPRTNPLPLARKSAPERQEAITWRIATSASSASSMASASDTPCIFQECRCKATWKREFKLSWREAGPPNHHDDKVDSDQ